MVLGLHNMGVVSALHYGALVIDKNFGIQLGVGFDARQLIHQDNTNNGF